MLICCLLIAGHTYLPHALYAAGTTRYLYFVGMQHLPYQCNLYRTSTQKVEIKCKQSSKCFVLEILSIGTTKLHVEVRGCKEGHIRKLSWSTASQKRIPQSLLFSWIFPYFSLSHPDSPLAKKGNRGLIKISTFLLTTPINNNWKGDARPWSTSWICHGLWQTRHH